MIPIDYNTLIHSICYYLSYQDRIGRSFMIDESSLKYPVADYLTSLEIPLVNIRLEYPHPNLKKRQIDLITTNDHLIIEPANIETAFEFKLAQAHTKHEAERKRIFNDLMRLYLLSKIKGSSAYFVIAGTIIDFIQNFRSIPAKRPTTNNKDLPEPEGFFTEWFNFEISASRSFDVKKALSKEYEAIYDAFLKDYDSNLPSVTLELPEIITTKCIAISALSRDFPTPYVGGIWKIE